MTNKKTSVGILGAGVSGLSVAHSLAKKGISATVYEKEDMVGGAISSVQEGDWLVEEGPNTIMLKSQALWDLIGQLGLSKDLLEADKAASKRYVVKDAKPVALPTSAGSFITSPLLSVGSKFRLLKEPFVPPSVQHDESIASFIERRLGSQPLDYGVNPFVSGIYAGDPKNLSIKHTFNNLWEMEQEHGSILKGFLKKDRSNSSAKRALISFKNGNQTLPKALADSLPNPVRRSTEIKSAKKQDGQWQISGVSDGEDFENDHACLVSTLPAYCLTNIFGAELFDDLANIPYAPLSVFALGFKEEQIEHPLDGFGMLIPEVENFKTLGALFSSTLFSGRAPAGHHLLTCFIGGARNPELASTSKEKLRDIVLEELDQLLGIEGEPVLTHYRFWEKAIPQYNVGYDHYLLLMKEIEKQHPGLYLDGNYRGGVSVPNCISSGFETAQTVDAFLKGYQEPQNND